MRWHYDDKVMTIRTTDPSVLAEMESVVRQIVLQGVLPNPWPQWAEDWFVGTGFTDPNKRLLVASTVFPQRILLSLVDEYRAREILRS